jgi:hypothetical protein
MELVLTFKVELGLRVIAMFETNFLTLMVVFLFASLLVYRSNYLRNKQLGYLSLTHVFTLVIIPGFLFPLIYNYMNSIIQQPLSEYVIFPDRLLINVILLSLMFTYGGVAIHEVTKLLSRPDYLRYEKNKAAELNRFFHLTFSHNLAYSGVLVTVISLTLLELNHVPHAPVESAGAILKGLGLGFSFMMSLFIYTRSEDEYIGEWNDLKVMFGVLWIGFILMLYAIRKVNPVITDYQLLLPAVLSMALLSFFALVLMVRRFKRGEWKLIFRWDKLKRLVQ